MSGRIEAIRYLIYDVGFTTFELQCLSPDGAGILCEARTKIEARAGKSSQKKIFQLIF
jgi:hypothetical protein